MKLPLAELETSTGAAVLEKMVGGISSILSLLRCLLNTAIEIVGGLLDKGIRSLGMRTELEIQI